MPRKPHRIPPFHSLVAMHLLHLRAAEKALEEGDVVLCHVHARCCELVQHGCEVMRQRKAEELKKRFGRDVPASSGPDSSGEKQQNNAEN